MGSLADAPAERALRTIEVLGEGEPARELVLPYRGEAAGDALHDRLDGWQRAGVMEPSAAEAVRASPTTPSGCVSRATRSPCSARVPRWVRSDPAALGRHGRRRRPAPPGALGAGAAAPPGRRRPAARADGRRRPATTPAPTCSPRCPRSPTGWRLGGRLVLGNYLYADGGTHVRVSVAADVLATRLGAARPDTALAFLATPTDVFAVPREAVEHSTRAYAERSGAAKLVGRPLRWVVPRPAAAPGLPPRGGPRHRRLPGDGARTELRAGQAHPALARRGRPRRRAAVSFHVAPSTRTRSVVKNSALAAAFAGAHRFGVEIFDPATANTLMAALLVHDLAQGTPAHDHPWQDEAYAAVHGGLWRAPYEPRSALGLAAVLGFASARG